MSSAPRPVVHLIDTISNEKAGTEKQLLETLRRLDRTRVEPLLVCLRSSAWLRENEPPCETIVLDYDGLISPRLPGVIARLRGLVDERRVRVVQTYFEDTIFLTALAFGARRDRPVLLSSRRDIGLGLGQPWYHRVFDFLRPFALARFDGVVANAEAAKRYTHETDRVPDDRITVIRNGIDLDVPASEPPRAFADPTIDFWIVMVANLNPVKRHDLLIDALAALKARDPELRFRALLLGKGPLENAILAHAAREGLTDHVSLVGSVDDVGAYLDHAHVAVLCSQREGLSNAILEAMKHGRPVVATDVGGNGELVDATNGALVPLDDPAAMAAAFHELARDPSARERAGKASRARVEALCSWDTALGGLLALYDRLDPPR